MISPESGVQLIRSESQRMKEYLNELPPDALDRSSACEGWTVADVVAHLIWAARDYYGVAVARGLRGDTSFPEGLPRREAAESTATDEIMLGKAIELRKSLGDQLLPTFESAFVQYSGRLTGLSPEDWEKPVYHPTGVRPVSRYVPGMIQELVIHDWDIRSSLEPSPSLPDSSLPVLMDRIPQRPRPCIVPFLSGLPMPLTYRFELTGPESGRWDVVVEDNKARLERADNSPANISLSCRSDTFVLLMYGRLTLDSARAAGRLTITGDESFIPDFDRWIKGG